MSDNEILFPLDLNDIEFTKLEIKEIIHDTPAANTAFTTNPIMYHYTDDELQALKRESFLAGVSSAQLCSCAKNEIDMSEIFDRIATALELDLLKSHQILQSFSEATSLVIINVLATMFPSLCARNTITEIVESIKFIISDNIDGSVVNIAVHSSLHADIRSALRILPTALYTRIALTQSDTLPAGDVRVAWPLGVATHSPERIRMGVIKILTEMNLIDPTTPAQVLAFQQNELLQPFSAYIEGTQTVV
jgi:hypothetical protein